MGRSRRKWHLKEQNENFFLSNGVGLMKLPNSSEFLGHVIELIEPTKGKYACEGVTFKCENGKIFLPIDNHDAAKSTSRFKDARTVEDLLASWNNTSSTDATTVPSTMASPEKTPRSSSLRRPLQEISPTALPLSKRLKFIEVEIDERIERCKKGTMELPIANISKPPKGSRLLREPDNIFILELKKRMIKDPSAPGAAPMAVLCKDINSIDTFEMKHKNVYSYEVLGGLHTLMAKSQLVDEHAENPFFKNCLAEVYVGLSDEEALRLSQRHNQTSHFVHNVTHRDLVEVCRARLYKMAGLDLEVDETPKPTPAWKDSCIKAIIPQDISKTHKDAIFSQAAMTKRVWTLAIQVMDLFKKCKLKGQKLKLATLMAEPEFKQQYLAPIRTLEENDQCSLLTKVINSDLTISELKEASAKIKRLDSLKKAFLKLVNIETWQKAVEEIPLFACTEQLEKFGRIDLKNGVPQSFNEFCLRAKQSLGETPESSESSDVIIKCSESSSSVHILPSNFTELCSNTITKVYANFTGVSLAVVCFDKEANADKISSMSYTIKEINSANCYNLYTAVGICDPSQGQTVVNAWSSAFKCTDTLYFGDKDALQGNSITEESAIFVPCVKQAVFGFFSVNDDGATKHRLNSSQQTPNYFQGTKKELFRFLVNNFSLPGAIILDMSDCQGILSEVAVQSGRNSICVLENDNCAEVISVLSSSLE